MSTPTFKELLEGATHGENLLRKAMVWGIAQRRLSPEVMRVVLEALDEAVARLSLVVQTDQATGTEEAVYRKCKSALALLNGNKP